VPIDPAGGTNLDRGSSWRASSAIYGSPAAANPAANLPSVRVNEILTADATVRNLILEGQNEKIQSLLEGSGDSTSFSFNKDIYRHIKSGKISKADGMRFSPNPQQLEMNLKGIFIKS